MNVKKLYHMGVLPYSIWIVVADTHEEASNVLSKTMGCESDSNPESLVGQAVEYEGDCAVMYGISYKRNVPYHVIAHEASHIAIYIFSRIETPINDDTTEVFAFLVEFICACSQQCFDNFDKKFGSLEKGS